MAYVLTHRYTSDNGSWMRGRSLNLKARILDRIETRGAGAVWTPVDFLEFGPRPAVDKALQRLVAHGDLRRVGRGLYFTPTMNRLTGKPNAPDSSAVVDAIARRDQIRCVVDGLTAANDLGLTTAVPAHVTVLADARLRPVRLGKQEIRFKHVAASRLYWAGRPAMRVVQALHWMRDVVPSNRSRVLDRLRRVLADPDHGSSIRDDLRAGFHTLPAWMQSLVRELIGEVPSGGAKSVKRDEAGKDGEAMRKKHEKAKKRWPPGKPLPIFASAAEEERFWLSHDFDDAVDTGGEEVVYQPRATRRPRT